MARGVRELEAAIKPWRQSTRPLRSRPFTQWRLNRLKKRTLITSVPGRLLGAYCTLSIHALVQAFKLFSKGLQRMEIALSKKGLY
jgi:hypothetical protein